MKPTFFKTPALRHLKTFLPVSFYNKNFVGGWDWWLGVGKMGGRVLLLFPHEARVSSWGFVLSLTPLLAPSLPSYPFIHMFSPPFSVCLLSTCPNFLPPPSLYLPLSTPPPVLSPAPSSLSAGCRGGFFLFTMSRINLRIRELLFSSLLRQDLGFFQETKTGEPCFWVWGPLSLPCVTLLPAPSSRFHLWGLAGAF